MQVLRCTEPDRQSDRVRIEAQADIELWKRSAPHTAAALLSFQYSDASMIVSTRRVTAGSAGFSLPNRKSRS